MRNRLAAATSALALGLSLTTAALAEEADLADRSDIVVTGDRGTPSSGTKTDTPPLETPQPITVVTDDVYMAQGAISISDTLRYVAGVQANPYGADSREDGGFIRGISPLQFRDGMRDIFSYFASIRADPYNFRQIEVVRGPASVLFGSGSIGGIVNLVSKRPEFGAGPRIGGEVALRYGSFDRKEALADLNAQLSDSVAARIVGRVRDAGTQVDHVPDDRVMIAPSLRWRPGPDTDVTFLGLYQEDDGGSTSQFLPNVGTLLPNPNGQLPNNTFIGKPGWDRYDGRLLQGTGIVTQRFGDNLRLNLKARYSDSRLTYLTHYPDTYTDPENPFLDAAQRLIGLYADGSKARLQIFTTDNNLQFDFNTGDAIKHQLLAGVDYSWNRVRKLGGIAYDVIDIYDIDYDALPDYGGGLPPGAAPTDDTSQRQIGVYVQDQIRIRDRVSIVLGARHDNVRTRNNLSGVVTNASAMTWRAGIIGELVNGVSPFFSYTQSFDPISGTASDGNPFKPKRGTQFEGGIKFAPDNRTLVTVTAFHIRERNRPVDDSSTPDPFDQRQAGLLTSKGFELEARRILPGDFEFIANYGYTWIREAGAPRQLADVAKHNASAWTTKTFAMNETTRLKLGAGVRHTSAHDSGAVHTLGYTLVDALVEVAHGPWTFALNANNLLGKEYYANCLGVGRADCFTGADRNVFGTLSYNF